MISNLPSLRRLSAKEVEGILSSLALDLSPDPGISAPTKRLNPDLRERLLGEIRVSLRLKKADNSPKSISKIHGYLAEEIQRVALSNVNINDVKTRLGRRGDLVPALYKLEFADSFQQLDEPRGIQRSQVENCLRNPDGVEHLSPADLDETEDNASVYIKTFNNRVRPENSYTLLVFCKRVGYLQKIHHAWHVFHSDLDLSNARSALDILKIFIDRYGIALTISEEHNKLFFYTRIPLETAEETETKPIRLQKGVPIGSLSLEFGASSDGTEVLIYWMFGVNYKQYDEVLLRHGVRKQRHEDNEDAKQVTSFIFKKVGTEMQIMVEANRVHD
jgi:hypothetical protein